MLTGRAKGLGHPARVGALTKPTDPVIREPDYQKIRLSGPKAGEDRMNLGLLRSRHPRLSDLFRAWEAKGGIADGGVLDDLVALFAEGASKPDPAARFGGRNASRSRPRRR